MNKKTSFTKFIRLWVVIIILMLGGSMVGIDVLDSHHDFQIRTNQMQDNFIARQQQVLKTWLSMLSDASVIKLKKQRIGQKRM